MPVKDEWPVSLEVSSSKAARNILGLQPHEKEAMHVGSQNNSNLFHRMCMIERLVFRAVKSYSSCRPTSFKAAIDLLQARRYTYDL